MRENTKIKDANKQFKEHISFLLSSIDSITDFVYFKDIEGFFVSCNSSFAEFVGKPKDEIVGKTVHDLFSQETADFFQENSKKIIELKQSDRCEEWVNSPAGHHIFIEIHKIPIIGSNGDVIGLLGLIRNITDKKQFEHDLQLKDNLLTAVAKSTNELVRNLDFNDAILKALNIVGNSTNVERIAIYQTSPNADNKPYTASIKFEWVSDTKFSHINKLEELQNLSFEKYGTFFQPLLEKKPVMGLINDFHDSMKTLYISMGVKSSMFFPIFIEDYLWGFAIFSDFTYERNWSESEQAILLSFSASLASVIERKQKREKEKLMKNGLILSCLVCVM